MIEGRAKQTKDVSAEIEDPRPTVFEQANESWFLIVHLPWPR